MLFLIAVAALQVFSVSGYCPGGFCERSLIYDELRCKPIFAQETDCCPTHYDCSHIEKDAEIKDKCHFHGKLYSPGESIDNSEIYGNCQVHCTCQNGSGSLNFTCDELDCPEWLGYNADFGCHLKYELDKCCSEGQVCPPFNHTCTAGEKTYHVGQKFPHPHEKCSSCVCSEDFNFGECKKDTCIEELTNRKDILNFCAPSYRIGDECCPWSWICPEETDNVVASKTPSPHPELKCKYGKRELNIGDSFERVGKSVGETVACECRTPPLLTCILTFPPRPPVETLEITNIEN